MGSPLASLATYDITATGAVMLVPIASWVVECLRAKDHGGQALAWHFRGTRAYAKPPIVAGQSPVSASVPSWLCGFDSRRLVCGSPAICPDQRPYRPSSRSLIVVHRRALSRGLLRPECGLAPLNLRRRLRKLAFKPLGAELSDRSPFRLSPT
jgi:hypothetical protein